ncbi:hypothetical protein BsWGS_16147 [Bradybaena similaris]
MNKMLFLRKILIIQMAVYLTEGRSPDVCDTEHGTLHPDPENCNRFYSCAFSKAYYHFCPPGLVFNAKFSVCDWPWNVDCRRISETTARATEKTPTTTYTTTTTSTTPTTTYTTTTTTSTSILPTSTLNETFNNLSTLPVNTAVSAMTVRTTNPPSPSFCYFKNDGLYADPERCASFYQCSKRNTHHLTCQQDLLYNSKFEYCDWPRNVNCSQSTGNPRGNESGSDQVNIEPTYSAAPPLNVNKTSAVACGNVLCYFPNWAVYRQGFGASFGPEQVNPDLCTHIIYAFAYVQGNRLVTTDPSDEPRGSDIGNYARITNLKLRNPRLKVILSVGGWNMGTSAFSSMTANKDNLAEFINTTIPFLRSRNFDGLDLDWEYPNSGANPAEDKQRYAMLCEELRAAFEKEASGDRRLLLTGAVAAGKYTIDTSYNVPRIAAAFDIIHIMTYDLRGTWNGKTGHHSPLKAGSWEANEERYLNIEWAANYWASLGAPKNKLAIGLPLYAKTFTLQSASRPEVGGPISGDGLPGKYTQQRGSLSYYEVCSLRNQSTTYEIRDQKVPYLVSGDQWVGYDSPASISEKVQFVLEQGFGGIMVWDLSMDDFSGRFCGQGSYPLVNAIHSQCALSVKN